MNLNLDHHQQTAQALPGPAECECLVQDRQEIMAGLPMHHGQECTLAYQLDPAFTLATGKLLLTSAIAGIDKPSPRAPSGENITGGPPGG